MKVRIRDDIARALRKRVSETGSFPDVEAYVNYILREVVRRLPGGQEGESSAEEEEELKKRLKKLGYLD